MHPIFDGAAIAAQRRLADIQGRRQVWFAGAWTGYGFHEDGLKSGLAVAHGIRSLAGHAPAGRLGGDAMPTRSISLGGRPVRRSTSP